MENSFMGPQKVKHRIVIFPEQLSTCPQELKTNIQKKRIICPQEPKVRNIRPSTDEQKNKTIFSQWNIIQP